MWEIASIVTFLPSALYDPRAGRGWANGRPSNLQHSEHDELS